MSSLEDQTDPEGSVPIESVRDVLGRYIKVLEKGTINNTAFALAAYSSGFFPKGLSETGGRMLRGLADIYLEYALTSKGEEAILYGLKAVDLNPGIRVKELFYLTKELGGIRFRDDHMRGAALMQKLYFTNRSPGEMKILEIFLEGIKQEAQKENALEEHQIKYDMISRGEIPDPHVYSSALTELSDSEFEQEKHRARRNNSLDVGGFLSDMLISAEQDKRDKIRWKQGKTLPQVALSDLEKIFSKRYPQHVIIHEEALGGIRLGESRRFEHVDEVCDRISTEISKRLPRRLDAYRFTQEGAEEEIGIEGLGKVRVSMDETGKGVFTMIRYIETSKFQIYNCRKSGRAYLDKYNETGMPYRIIIKPLQLELTLYDDDSGIFIKEKGNDYTNSRVDAMGRGYEGDSYRDQMYRKRKHWGIDRPDPKPDKSWEEESKRIAGWLEENVLEKILATPVAKEQETNKPDAVPYPKEIGPLYTWISEKKAAKVVLTGGDPSKVLVDERAAIVPGWRLCSWGTEGEFPKEAYNGFIWCGIGKPKPNSAAEDYPIEGHHMDSEFGSYKNRLIEVNPHNGEEIYVVDYQAWDDYREKAFRKTKRLSNNPVDEMYTALARTMVKIGDYKGDYKKPTVIISRDIGLDEVSIVPGVVYDPGR